MDLTEIEIRKTLKELRQLSARKAFVEEAIADRHLKLQEHMTEMGIDQFSQDGFLVSWTEITTTRLDTKALQKALPEVYDRFSRQSGSRRFCIRAVM